MNTVTRRYAPRCCLIGKESAHTNLARIICLLSRTTGATVQVDLFYKSAVRRHRPCMLREERVEAPRIPLNPSEILGVATHERQAARILCLTCRTLQRHFRVIIFRNPPGGARHKYEYNRGGALGDEVARMTHL